MKFKNFLNCFIVLFSIGIIFLSIRFISLDGGDIKEVMGIIIFLSILTLTSYQLLKIKEGYSKPRKGKKHENENNKRL